MNLFRVVAVFAVQERVLLDRESPAFGFWAHSRQERLYGILGGLRQRSARLSGARVSSRRFVRGIRLFGGCKSKIAAAARSLRRSKREMFGIVLNRWFLIASDSLGQESPSALFLESANSARMVLEALPKVIVELIVFLCEIILARQQQVCVP